jgi:hypothetical protein
VKKLLLVTMVTLSMAAFSTRAEAGFITGDFSFGSNCEVHVSAPGGVGTIDFLSQAGVVCSAAPDPLPGDATINASSLKNGGVLIPGLVGTVVKEVDLNSATNPTGAPGATPFTLPFSEIFVAAPNLNFTLKNIVQCQFSPVAGACGPFGPTSPFVFVPGIGQNSTVSIFLEGTVFDTATSTLINNFTGHIDAAFHVDLATLLAQFAAQGYIQTAFAGTKVAVQGPVSAVPEPATLLTFGLGTTYIAWRQRRKNRNK